MPSIVGLQRSLVLRGLVQGSGVLLFTAVPGFAQSQIWIDQIGTSSQDRTMAAAPDGAGGVYVGGLTQGSLGGVNLGSDDAWLARYGIGGTQLWVRQLGTSQYDAVLAAAPCTSGGTYVVGHTKGNLVGPSQVTADAWIARYDDAGGQAWIRQLDSSDGGLDAATAVAPDGSGGAYLGGNTSGSLGGPFAGGTTDAWFARVDEAGATLWIRQLGTAQQEWVNAAAPDGIGGVFVGGLTSGSLALQNAGGTDAWLAKYDGAGAQVWVRQLGTTENDWVQAAAPDGAGGVYVGGVTEAFLGGTWQGSLDAWLARYDSAGNQLWIRQLGTSFDDRAYSLSSDGMGGVFVAGATTGSLGGPSSGDFDAWLARYDSSGTPVWLEQLGTSGPDDAIVAAPDGSGGVFLGGQTGGNLAGPNAGEVDAWFARFDGSCNSGTTYCIASTTSIPGCQAALSGSGSPSFAHPNDFTISSGPVPGGNLGISFFGDNGTANLPFGTLGGRVCVQGPFFRTVPKSSGGNPDVCDGSYAFTLQDLIDSSSIIVSGAAIHAEIWARDPANPDGFLLSNGIEFTVCP